MDFPAQYAAFRNRWNELRADAARVRAQGVSKAQLRAWIPVALMIVGAVLLVYVASQYLSMYTEQRRLAQQWEQENARPTLGSAEKNAVVDDGLTRISIPKIDLDAVVVEGASRKQLAVAPGHIKETVKPGEDGNAVITAHRDTFFRHIYELKKGDSILIRRRGELYKFEVTGKKVVDPEDVSVLRHSKEPRLTLITCYPTYYIGPAPERLVVFSKLVERAPQSAATNQSTAAGTP